MERIHLNVASKSGLESQIRDWIGLPRSELVLPAPQRTVIPETVRVSLKESDGQSHAWGPVLDFSRSGPGDRHFVVERQAGRLRFGDGYNGRVPRPSTPNIEFAVDYSIGGGAAGNFEQSRYWDADAPPGWSAINVVPSRSGADPESLDAALTRTASERRSPSRAVTARDFEVLAETTPGVAIRRAIAAVGAHPSFPCTQVPGAISIYIVPDRVQSSDERASPDLGSDLNAPMPDPGTIEAVTRRLSAARLVTQEIFVLPPQYREFTVVVTLAGHPEDTQSVRSQVTAQLANFLHPLHGGDDGRGWPFGAAISPSALMRRVQPVLDDDLEIVGVAIRPGNGGNFEETCLDVTIGEFELVALRQVIVRFVDRPESAEVLS
jgi:predicted phage baseplate assembly protein